MQDDAKQGLVEFLEENSIDLVISGSATTSRFRKTLNVRCAPVKSGDCWHADLP